MFSPSVTNSSDRSCDIFCSGYKLFAIFLVTKFTPISYMKSLKPSLVSIWKSPIMNSGKVVMLMLLLAALMCEWPGSDQLWLC